MPRVFISHAAADRAFVVDEMVPRLREEGVDSWYCEAEIGTASQWEREIRAGLESCDWFLVVLTPRSVSSPWVSAEVHWAFDERPGRVIPVLLETSDWPALHLMLRTVQHVDMRTDRDAAWRRLLATWRTVRDGASPIEAPTAAQATLRFVVSKATGLLTPFHVYIDGALSGDAKRGGTLEVSVAPGHRHVLVAGVGAFKEASDEIDVEAGRTYVWDVGYTLLGGTKIKRR